MRSRQSGMTFLGLLVLIVVVGSWVYAGIRLVPAYLNYQKVASTLEKVRDEYDSNPGTTAVLIRNAIMRHFDIEMINEDVLTFQDVVIRQESGVFVVTAAYEHVVPLVANVSFLLDFDKTVEIQAR